MTKLELWQYAKELKEWLAARKLSIGGCGCCGSPWLEPEGCEHEAGTIDDLGHIDTNEIQQRIEELSQHKGTV